MIRIMFSTGLVAVVVILAIIIKVDIATSLAIAALLLAADNRLVIAGHQGILNALYAYAKSGEKNDRKT